MTNLEGWIGTRAANLKPSPTLAITAKAAELKAAGHDVISLSAGQPDFDTPQHICEAAHQAIRDGKTRYTPAAGIKELRQAAADLMSHSSGQNYAAEQIVVTCGAKQALYNTFFVTISDNDAVVIPAPCWVTYPAQVELCGGVPRVVPPKEDGALDLDGIAEQCRGARAIVFSNPSNPTGQVLEESELQAIGALAREHDLLVVTDEIYSELVYGDQGFVSFLQACPDLIDRTVCIQGVSKSSAMTGWRIGFAAAPPDIAQSMSALMSQTTSNPNSIAQWGALAALTESRDFLDEWLVSFARRRNLLLDGLRSIDGIECRMPEGAFYAFPDVRGLMEKKGCSDDTELAERLLNEALVAVVPGTPFFAPGHIRLSYATSDEALATATSRIAHWACEP